MFGLARTCETGVGALVCAQDFRVLAQFFVDLFDGRRGPKIDIWGYFYPS